MRWLLSFLKNCYLYRPKMTEADVYRFFINDCKNKNPHRITNDFCKDLKEIEKDIIDLDGQNYYRKGNNNLVRLVLKYQSSETESSLKKIKRKLRNRLYIYYISIFGL